MPLDIKMKELTAAVSRNFYRSPPQYILLYIEQVTLFMSLI